MPKNESPFKSCFFVEEKINFYTKVTRHDYYSSCCFQIAGTNENIISDKHSYLLATGGNDSLVKLWKITIGKVNVIAPGGIGSSSGDVRYEEKKCFTGHGGNVTCVRFSPIQSEILGSVATDRTARIWSVVSKYLTLSLPSANK